MRKWNRMPGAIAVAVAASVLIVGEARAGDDDDVGAGILACFHPAGLYRDTYLGSPVFRSDGMASISGRVDFRGLLTENAYYMRFTIYLREVAGSKELRVEPGEDTSPFPANPDCRLRSWTPID